MRICKLFPPLSFAKKNRADIHPHANFASKKGAKGKSDRI